MWHSVIRAGALSEGPSPFLIMPLLRLIIITLVGANILHAILEGPTIIRLAEILSLDMPF